MTEQQRPLPSAPDHTQGSSTVPEDEINLLDVLAVLVRKKNLILVVLSVFILGSILYAQSFTPKFRATIGFLPSDKPDLFSYFPDNVVSLLHSFNENKAQGKEPVKYGPWLFQKFLTTIQSSQLQEKVFNEGKFLEKFLGGNQDADKRKVVLGEISNALQIKPGNGQFTYLEMVGTKPKAMADFLNALAESAMVETVNNLKVSLQQIIKSHISKLSENLETYLAEAKLEREQKIRHLLNNLEIAKKLGVVKNNFNSSSFTSSSAFVLRKDDVLEEALPLWYLYGQYALEQELEVLRRQPISIQITEEVTSLKLKIAELSKIDLSNLTFEPAIVSQTSIPPDQPFEPEKIKIVTTGAVLGLFVAIFLAFFSHFVELVRVRQSSDSA